MENFIFCAAFYLLLMVILKNKIILNSLIFLFNWVSLVHLRYFSLVGSHIVSASSLPSNIFNIVNKGDVIKLI